jgi:hypothetical protein
MTKVFVDAATRERLHDLDGLLEVCDESGRTLGYFHPVANQQTAAVETRSPFTKEEIERRRAQRTGRSLGEILNRLEQP